MPDPIPVEDAVRICQRVRSKVPFSQCWGCIKFSKGDPKRMCFHDPPGNRGCSRINKEFDTRSY